MNRISRSWLWTSLLVVGVGCGDEVPIASEVEDLRVLAIQAEPPELLMDRAQPDALPVSFRALVVDPRGGPMAYEWQFCPIESTQTCGDFAQRRAAAPPALQPYLDAARGRALAGQASAGGAGEAGGELGVEAFVVPVDPGLFSYHLQSSGLGLGNGAWASAVLGVQAGAERLMAQKRVVLNARDLSDWNPELAGFGWQVCPPPPQVALPGCLPVRPRVANRNPVVEGIEVARGETADTPFVPLEPPLLVAPGETLRLRPRLGPGAEEPFQTIESTLQANQLVVVDRSEEPVASWFTTAGEFSDAQTTRQLTKTLDSTFTAPAAGAPGTRFGIYVVVRDQRGGVGWARVAAEIR